jgi:hypothetical protein
LESLNLNIFTGKQQDNGIEGGGHLSTSSSTVDRATRITESNKESPAQQSPFSPISPYLDSKPPISLPQLILTCGRISHGIQRAEILIPTPQGK